MRRFVIFGLALSLLGAAAFAAAPHQRSQARMEPVVSLAGVKFATQAELAAAVVKDSQTGGKRPAVLLQTDYYVYPYSGGDTPTLWVSIDPAGYGQPVTMWLYWQDRTTGERRYIANGEILDRGDARDIFGTSGTPVWTPTFDEFVLFGEGGAFGVGPDNDTGLFMFGFELRDAAGGGVVSTGYALYSHVDDIVTITGDVATDTVWTNNNAYLLAKGGAQFPVYVGARDGNGASATLIIQPGTVIFGDQEQLGTLSVQRGSKLIANGTSMMPIIMTSAFPVGERSSGDWGGLVLNGYAPVGSETGEREGEGETGLFGGDDPYDSSGVLSYVRVEFAGIRFTEEDELNGIALQGVGAGTVINNVQVNRNADDGIEFFGGTVNAQNVLLTGCEDDSFDWTFGWNGYVSNAIAWQGLAASDHGIEADNDEDVPDREPRSDPKIFNATFIGTRGGFDGKGLAARLRRGTAGKIRNAIFQGFVTQGIRVTEDETWIQVEDGNLVVANTFLYDNANVGIGGGNISDEDVIDWLEDPANGNHFEDPMLADPYNTLVPDLRPLPGGAAALAGAGGLAPGDDWCYQPWVAWAQD